MHLTSPQQVPCSFQLLCFQGYYDRLLWTLAMQISQFLSAGVQIIILNVFTKLWSNKDALFWFCITDGSLSLKYSKPLPCLFIALTKFFINPNLRCSVGNKVLSLSASSWFLTHFSLWNEFSPILHVVIFVFCSAVPCTKKAQKLCVVMLHF
jgi:hypothetical protein